MLRKTSENEQKNEMDSADELNENDESERSSNCEESVEKPSKKKKRGIIYISTIPKHMNVTILREMLGQHAKIGRIFLQPGKLTSKFFTFRSFQFVFILIKPNTKLLLFQMKKKIEKRKNGD